MKELTLVEKLDKRSPVCVDKEFFQKHIFDIDETGGFVLEWRNHPDGNVTRTVDCVFARYAASRKPDVEDSFFATGVDNGTHECYVFRFSHHKVVVLYPAFIGTISSDYFQVIERGTYERYPISQFFKRKPIPEYQFVSNIRDILEVGKAYMLMEDNGETHDAILTNIGEIIIEKEDYLVFQFYESGISDYLFSTGAFRTITISSKDIALGRYKIYDIRRSDEDE